MAVNPNIKKKADDIRNKVYGKEVRESLASGLEEMSSDLVENEGKQSVVEGRQSVVEGRQDSVEFQWQTVSDEMTDKDVVSAPEIIAARNGEANLKARLDKEHQDVTTQLAQTENRLNGVVINAMHPPAPFNSIKSDANYYDEANFKYYKDEAMTIPATDNKPALEGLVDYLADRGGGTIQIPNGKYAFRSSVRWKSKVSLIGSGKLSTSLFGEGVSHSLITGTIGASNGSDADKPEVWFEDCTFKDFLIDNKGLSYEGNTVAGKAIFILYMKRALFRDLILLNTLGTALGCDFLVDTVIDNVFTDRAGRSTIAGYGGNSGIGIGTCSLPEESVIVNNCFAYNSGNYGMFVETQNNPSGVQSKYAKFINCHSMGNRLGFGNKGSGGTQFIGCTAFNNAEHGFHLTQESSGDQLIGCVSEHNGGSGVMIERTYNGDLMLSDIKTNYNGEAGIRALNNLRTLTDTSVSNVQASYNNMAGVWFGGGTENLRLSGISAVNNGQDAINSHSRGILVEGTNDIVSILGSTVYDNQETKTQVVGIDVSSNTTNYVIDGNNVIGYSNSTGYQISSNSGVIGNNGGLITEKHGIATIPDGQSVLEVVHEFGSNPSSIILTPYDRGTAFPQVWVDRRDGNMFRIRREGSSGDLQVYWEAKV